MDLFEMARVPQNVPLETALQSLAALKAEGHFAHFGMSECSAESLRKGHAVHPIAAVEIEVSPWSMEPETHKVLSTAEELGIAVVAYSWASSTRSSRIAHAYALSDLSVVDS